MYIKKLVTIREVLLLYPNESVYFCRSQSQSVSSLQLLHSAGSKQNKTVNYINS